jgi:tetratricopeptide (TPR) repeat protein
MRAAAALRSLTGRGVSGDPADHALVAELAVSTQAVAADLELAGAFELAYAILHALLHGFTGRMAPRNQGYILAQLGRAARQLAATDVAREMYEEALSVGFGSGAMDVVARAQLGLGSTALSLGNYPLGREQFERALVHAEHANDPDLIRHAHHGLLNCGLAAGDLDAAMVHGWSVLRLCIAPDSRAEALVNMAEICRMSGEHDAALRTYTVAMEWTSRAGLRMHAMSGAMQSAIAIRRFPEARRYLVELEAALPGTPDEYTRAIVGVEMADAMHRLGDMAAAELRLSEALSVARANAYHEIVHRAEQAASAWVPAPSPANVCSKDIRPKRRHRSEDFRRVLRSLNGLTATTL